jgi:hypothetical protein
MQLQKTWIDSLRIGAMRAGKSLPKGLKFFLPFYGDAMNEFIGSSCNETSDSDHIFRSGHGGNMAADIYAALTQELQRVARAKAAAEATNLTFWSSDPRAVGGNVNADLVLRNAGPRGTVRNPDEDIRGDSLNSFLRIVEKLWPHASHLVVGVFEDVSTYLGNPVAREQILSIVEEKLTECFATSKKSGEAVVIVAHSLGSVVIHDLLATRVTEGIDLLLTIGSPLGMEGIRKRLQATIANNWWPPTVRAWVNASDSRDAVALIPVFGRNRFFAEAYRVNKDARCDVLNLVDIDNDTDNRHGITGYLSDPGVANVVVDALSHG